MREPMREPSDREALAAAGGMVDEIFPADVCLRLELRRDVVGDFPNRPALVVAGKQCEGRTLRPVGLGFAVGHADQKERERFQ